VRITRTRSYQLAKNMVKQIVPGQHAWHGPLDDSDAVAAVEAVQMEWPDGVRKPLVAVVRDPDVYPYWTKYVHFLEANAIPFELFDIHRSGWLDRAARFDAVVWRPMSFPSEVEECRRKVFALERELGTLCYPSFPESMLYEDKLLQYELLRRRGLPAIETFVSHSQEEALDYVAACDYPVVWKVGCGSGSLGVELVRDAHAARRLVRRVFSFSGRRTYWPYLGQKDYVYLQRLEPNRGWDVRVIVIGDAVFGYYRDVPAGEFRASGMGLVRRGAPPEAAMLIARRVARAFDLPQVAVDLLAHPADDHLSIIEISSFFQAATAMQLRVEGVPGLFLFSDDDSYRFVPAVVWPQELALRLVLERRWLEAGRGREEGST
jgi:Glutathione synthase/Ribosomal protein S6 modification enzyme (glutaminyl transferase)